MTYNIKKLEPVDNILAKKLKKYVYEIVGCCQEVHRELGPFLNEYMYQEALTICLNEHQISPVIKEYKFSATFHGVRLHHTHVVDFFVKDKVFIECKAIEELGREQRQQLWNYMRLTGIRIGILYNFAPVIDQCEKYYLDTKSKLIYAF